MWLMALDVGILSCAGGDSWGSRRGKSDGRLSSVRFEFLVGPVGLREIQMDVSLTFFM